MWCVGDDDATGRMVGIEKPKCVDIQRRDYQQPSVRLFRNGTPEPPEGSVNRSSHMPHDNFGDGKRRLFGRYPQRPRKCDGLILGLNLMMPGIGRRRKGLGSEILQRNE